MALTNRGKQYAMEQGVFPDDDTNRFISFHLPSNTELSGHGYARKSINHSQLTIASTGIATGPTNFQIYTASDASAQDAGKWALYDALTGGSQIYEPEDFTTDVGAPANGQAVRLTPIFNP